MFILQETKSSLPQQFEEKWQGNMSQLPKTSVKVKVVTNTLVCVVWLVIWLTDMYIIIYLHALERPWFMSMTCSAIHMTPRAEAVFSTISHCFKKEVLEDFQQELLQVGEVSLTVARTVFTRSNLVLSHYFKIVVSIPGCRWSSWRVVSNLWIFYIHISPSF